MNKCNSGIFVTTNIPNIITLMFADDIASPADTGVQSQRQINAIEDYSNTVGMSINLKKTKVVVFRNGGPQEKVKNGSFTINLLKQFHFTSIWV